METGADAKRPLRVLQLIGSAEAGGAEQFFLRLMMAFAQRREEITILPVVRADSWLSQQLRRVGIRFEEAGYGKMLPIFTRKRVAAIAQEFKPTVVTAWMKRAALMVPPSPPVPPPGELDESWKTVGRLGGYYDLKYFRGRVTELVGNTPDICRWAREEGWPGQHVAYLPNFVPAPPAGWRDNRAALRQRLGVPPNALLLLLAGRLHEVKGIDIALQALERLDEKFHLLVVGSGPEEKKLRRLADDLKVAPRVHWVEWQPYLSPWVGAADIWIAPSREEPLGNVVLDAWAHGVPIVASRAKGPVMLIEHGVNGRLVKAGDPVDLANELKDLADRRPLMTRLVTGGAMTWRQKFSEQVVVELWLEYYEGLIRGIGNGYD